MISRLQEGSRKRGKSQEPTSHSSREGKGESTIILKAMCGEDTLRAREEVAFRKRDDCRGREERGQLLRGGRGRWLASLHKRKVDT